MNDDEREEIIDNLCDLVEDEVATYAEAMGLPFAEVVDRMANELKARLSHV